MYAEQPVLVTLSKNDAEELLVAYLLITNYPVAIIQSNDRIVKALKQAINPTNLC
jgi:hypothetical protein